MNASRKKAFEAMSTLSAASERIALGILETNRINMALSLGKKGLIERMLKENMKLSGLSFGLSSDVSSQEDSDLDE